MPRLALSFAAILLSLWRPAVAQTASDTAGAISGRVTDATGAPIAGVTVSLSSAGLISPLTFTTDERGDYRFPALLPAAYTVVFSRIGFRTVTYAAVPVLLGHTVPLDVTLTVAATSDVTVEATAPLLDRRSTMLGVTFDSDQLTNMHGPRSIGTLMSALHSVLVTRMDVAGSNVLSSPTSAYGTAGSNRTMLEGILIVALQTYGLTLDFGSFQEVSIGAASFGADVNIGPGLFTQFITKSGGNRYHATFYGDIEPSSWQSFNITPAQIDRASTGRGGPISREDNRMISYFDVNGDVSGYVVRDRSWWAASARHQEIATRVATFPEPQRMRFDNVSAKSTTRLGAGGQLVLYLATSRTAQPTRLDAFLVAVPQHESAASTSDQRASGWFSKIEWRSTIGRQHFVEARVAYVAMQRRDRPRSDALRYEDTSSGLVSGATRDWLEQTTRPQVLVTSTSYLKGPAGEHQLKAGGEIYRFFNRESWFGAFVNGVIHQLNDGTPTRVRRYTMPSRSETGMWWFAAYATDFWRISDRLSATLGARFDRFRLFRPAQVYPPLSPGAMPQPAVNNLIDWNVVSPRISVVASVTGDGRTLAKASYARYPDVPGTDLGFNANPNSNVWWTTSVWNDDGNGVWSAGEDGTVVERRGGFEQEHIDPNLRLPYTREVAAWLERELPGRVVVRSGLVWRGERDLYARQDTSRPFTAYVVPSAVIDRGPGNDGDGSPIDILTLPPNHPTGPYVVKNVPGAETSTITWEISALRRQVGRWTLLAGFAHNWDRDHASAYFGQAVRQNVLPLTPNDYLHTDAKGRHVFTTWSARLQLTVDTVWGLRVTPFVRHQAGQPFGRTLSRGSEDPRVVLTEPVGTGRMDQLTVTDLRIEKRIARLRTSFFVDVYNLFNANGEQTVVWVSNTSQQFLRPTSIVPPRIARLGVRVNW